MFFCLGKGKMLNDKQIKQIRDELTHCQRPMFFFHDDPDGLCSFLLCYRYIHEGKGVVIKTHPKINTMFMRSVEEYGADKVFVLDIAMIDQDFIDKVGVPVVWVDHHEPQDRKGVKYFNPRIGKNENIPPSRMLFDVVEQDMWISMCGCIGDWYMPDFKDKFCEKYPDLLDKSITKPEEALFNSKLGELVKMLSFNLKGKTQEVMKSAKVLTRIESPNEILEQSTPRGRFIYKKYQKVKVVYDELLKKAEEAKTEDSILLFNYHEDKLSITKELSNEMIYRHPDKVVIIAREKSGEMKCSLRSGEKVILTKILEKALIGIEGYGGGHEHACGAVIKKDDFPVFLNNIREELKKQ